MTKTSGILICVLAVCGCTKTQPPAIPIPQKKAIAAPAAQTDGTGVASLEVTVMPEEILPPPPPSPLKPEYLASIQLSTPMAEALAKYAPGFVSWKIEDYPPKQIEHYPYAANSLPYAVKGDFNGDGIIDIALTGHDDDNAILVVLMSSPTGSYYPVEIEIGTGDVYKRARQHGTFSGYKPLDILIFKPKGMVANFSIDSEDIQQLKFDGFNVKSAYDLVSDDDAPEHMTFQEAKSHMLYIFIWNTIRKRFNVADGGCAESNTRAKQDYYYCF